MKSIRLLGITMERVADFRSKPNTVGGGLYVGLDNRFTVVDIVRPAPSSFEMYMNKLRHIRPNRNEWRSHASLSFDMYRRRTAIAEQELQKREGTFDLIVQLYGIFSPGRLDKRRPFVLHTDNTYALSERYYPAWAPLRGQARAAWLAAERATYQQASFLFPLSEFTRRSMIEDYGCDPERVIRVGGGSNFSPVPIDNKRYDTQIALFVGSDFERKGGMTLLKAFQQVRQVLPNAQLWIVGPKRPLAGPQPGVTWHGHIKDRAKVKELFSAATVFVMPSLFEAWGYVFYEAMAYGLPCIAANHCAMPEIVADGETGLLVPPGQPEPLAAALNTLLGDPALAETMGRRGHTETLNANSWDDVAARMAPYIEQAVAERAGSAAYAL